MSNLDRPQISVVVCTHNRAELAALCVESLIHQSINPPYFEILIIDSASTDKTLERMQVFEEHPHVRIFHEEEPGLSKARNRGLKEASAPIAAFIDDDAVAHPDWLQHVIHAFKAHEVVAVGGPVELKYECTPPAWLTGPLLEPLGFRNHGNQPVDMTGVINLLGANCAFLIGAALDQDGFNENLGRIGSCLLSGEETELQRKLEAAGGIIRYAPQALVHHFVPAERLNAHWFMQRYYWGGISDAFMPSFHRKGQGASPHHEVVGRQSSMLLFRVLLNAYDAMPWQPVAVKIPARIYFAYGAGYLVGKSKKLFHGLAGLGSTAR